MDPESKPEWEAEGPDFCRIGLQRPIRETMDASAFRRARNSGRRHEPGAASRPAGA